MEYDVDLDALQGFIDESNDSLQGIEADFIVLEDDPGNAEIINRIFRPIHSLKGNSGFFGLTNINKFSHRLENLLDACRKGEIIINKKIIDILLKGVEYLQAMLDRAQKNPAEVAFLNEEKDFLAQVEAVQPIAATGSIQSVITLEHLLHEFLNLGQNIQSHPLIPGLLDQIEKANIDLQTIIAAKKQKETKSAFSPDSQYFLGDRDFSSQLAQFGLVLNFLNERKPAGKELLLAFAQALTQVSEALQGNETIADELGELFSMRNFLDDALMMASDEYNTLCRNLLNSVIGCFEARSKSGTARLGEILMEQQLVSKTQISAALSQQKKIGELLIEQGAIRENDLKKALEIQNKRALDAHLNENKNNEQTKTIRIDQARLDNFADSVGGLYISLDSLNFLKKQMETTLGNFKLNTKLDGVIHSLDEQLEKLHSNIMSIRRVPVKSLFQRFPKVVRQLSTSLCKEVRFTISGEETVIDKDLLEKIENPLVHILRNSLDHGLEAPDERKKAGKPEQGCLTLHARADENNVYIIIEDDGQGINPRKMKEVAIKKGFMTAEELQRLSDRELINLIFRPGFSSVEKISEVSGRGVGMDVVMSGLKECNGAIQLDSTVGKGTTVSLTVPLTKTLVTKDAMLAESGKEIYAIPSDEITTVIETENIIPLLAENSCIAYDGAILRLIELNTFFYPKASSSLTETTKKKVVVVCKPYGVCLLVDGIQSHQKIVAKEFGKGYQKLKKIDGIRGYTIMGNDDIVLIADIKEIAEHAL
ncbi:MAG: chemotaxis protein CheA [Desulfobulbaceae bacterium]|nr:chemotaxis protein CheA [Desulfobulbaceae bacterium]HIJ90070.1 chemotaxis protein CheA [Deltaproteobacteria bacterium]